MKQRWFFIVLLNVAFIIQMSGQVTTPPKGKKTEARQKEQLQIDEQLASRYYREQDYEKARDLYAQLFEKTDQTVHFQQYIECLILLKDYDKAEKELKSFAKKHPTYYKATTDLIYIYTIQGNTDKAKKQFNDILKDLPDNASTIRNLSYALQARGLYDMSMAILEKGNKLLEGKETFYMEQANLNLSMINYQEAFRYYFKEMETHPGQYNNIRNRLQTLMFYDVNNSISDELRIALLRQTQEKPDNLEFAQLLVWFALQQEDYDIALAQSQSIDRKTHDQVPMLQHPSSEALHHYRLHEPQFLQILRGCSNDLYTS